MVVISLLYPFLLRTPALSHLRASACLWEMCFTAVWLHLPVAAVKTHLWIPLLNTAQPWDQSLPRSHIRRSQLSNIVGSVVACSPCSPKTAKASYLFAEAATAAFHRVGLWFLFCFVLFLFCLFLCFRVFLR